jgi:hypothetical protein
MFFNCLTGPTRKAVLLSETMFPIVYKIANVTGFMIANKDCGQTAPPVENRTKSKPTQTSERIPWTAQQRDGHTVQPARTAKSTPARACVKRLGHATTINRRQSLGIKRNQASIFPIRCAGHDTPANQFRKMEMTEQPTYEKADEEANHGADAETVQPRLSRARTRCIQIFHHVGGVRFAPAAAHHVAELVHPPLGSLRGAVHLKTKRAITVGRFAPFFSVVVDRLRKSRAENGTNSYQNC